MNNEEISIDKRPFTEIWAGLTKEERKSVHVFLLSNYFSPNVIYKWADGSVAPNMSSRYVLLNALKSIGITASIFTLFPKKSN